MPASYTKNNWLLSASIAASLAVISIQDFVFAQTSTTTSSTIPTKTVTVNGRTVQTPDFNSITFESLPPTTSSGSLTIPSEAINYLGFDPSTSWVAGQEAETFLKLGSLFGFGVQKMSLQKIADLTNIRLNTLGLNKFQVIEWQSAQSLKEAIPGLEDMLLQDVAPLANLFKKYGISPNRTVGNAIRAQPEVAAKLLGEELDLSAYKIKDIPGLGKVPLQDFKGWAVAVIDGIPSLSQVHWNDFPVPPPGVIRTVAPIDFPWSKEEMMSQDAIPHVISGSVEPTTGLYTIPVPPPIGQKIPYVELTDNSGAQGPSYGARWFASSQEVPGGYGRLRAFNGGKEPTGLATYAPLFKISLNETDESKGLATFNMHFRYCMQTPLFDYGCTPYSFATFPWFSFRETEEVVVTTSY